MSNDQVALDGGMNFPGKRWLRHWFWILAFKYPRSRLTLTRLLIPSRNIDIQLFDVDVYIIGYWQPWGQPAPDQMFPHKAFRVAEPTRIDEPCHCMFRIATTAIDRPSSRSSPNGAPNVRRFTPRSASRSHRSPASLRGETPRAAVG